ncbi:ROK family protein [Streptococcus merionis]|uniref:ROK protein n=1 Tax=Streptococcus merionis TaxID=400065 RepID=A0A239SWD9_9STRE|nr:ROK family protein [Streptococcus merionis]SNU89054.1 ROK protein [Streptococcus merionis]
MNHYLSIDVGGTHIKYALFDKSGKLLQKNHCETPQNLEAFLVVVDQLIAAFAEQIRGVAVSCPGKIDTKAGIIYYGGALTYLHELNLSKHIWEKFGLPATVVNDGKAAALAEFWQGNLRGVNHGLALILGTGVGGGIISDGKLLLGQHFQAGELSLMAVPSETLQPLDMLGMNGSAVRMIGRVAEKLGLENRKDGRAVFEAINAKDERVYPIFQDFCRNIAYLIYNVQAVLDMKRVVIGGGISAQSVVLEEIQAQYQSILNGLGPFQFMVTPVDIQVCAFGSEANLIGAIYQLMLMEKSL